MSHRIPVFYMPVDVGGDVDIDVAKLLVAMAYDDRAGCQLCSSTSGGWWHPKVTLLLCESWNVFGLEFMRSEVACLERRAVQRAANAITWILELVGKCGLPDPVCELAPALGAERPERLLAAARAAEPTLEVDEHAGAVSSFFTFLVSLRQVLRDAAAAERHVLWCAPQP